MMIIIGVVVVIIVIIIIGKIHSIILLCLAVLICGYNINELPAAGNI